MAFRHAEVEDPLCLFYLMSRQIPQKAKAMGIELELPTHTHFIYDRGMTIWAGDWLGWLFARLGGIPIHRGKPLDRMALKTARELFAHGKFPLTIAPEGATNGHGEIISPLELGAAQLSCWGVEDLKKAHRDQNVVIVPISIRYFFQHPPWDKIAQLLTQLEKDSGLRADKEQDLYERLFRLGVHLVEEMEQFYHRLYRQPIATPVAGDRHQVLKFRLENLLDTALRVAENSFGLEKQGNIIDRCRRLEEVGWNAIYREDITDLAALSPMQRGLANWTAQEADLKIRHMRLVESLVAVRGNYVYEKPTAERFAETLWIVSDVMARIKGIKNPRRAYLGQRRVKIAVGEPMPITERWEAAQTNRKAAKQLVLDLTRELETALNLGVAQISEL